MSKKRIGLLYTGGTIGMMATEHGYAPMPDFAAALNAVLSDHVGTLPDFTLHEFEPAIDSANATPLDWQKIGRVIAAHYDNYDGFVVLHGTDTMAYTASALSFMLQRLRKPVIMTGAQIPLGVADSDALQNLMTSLQLAASDTIHEVAIYFNQRLLRGNRSTKISTVRFDAFESPNYPHLADGGVDVQVNAATLLPCASIEKFEFPEYLSGRILSVRFMPGTPTQAVRAMLEIKPQALILECYGTGNVSDHDPDLLQVLSAASADGVVVVVRSQALHGPVALGAYATGAGLVKAGVVGALDMTFETVFAKLHHLFALGLTPDEVRAAMVKNLSGELTA